MVNSSVIMGLMALSWLINHQQIQLVSRTQLTDRWWFIGSQKKRGYEPMDLYGSPFASHYYSLWSSAKHCLSCISLLPLLVMKGGLLLSFECFELSATGRLPMTSMIRPPSCWSISEWWNMMSYPLLYIGLGGLSVVKPKDARPTFQTSIMSYHVNKLAIRSILRIFIITHQPVGDLQRWRDRYDPRVLRREPQAPSCLTADGALSCCGACIHIHYMYLLVRLHRCYVHICDYTCLVSFIQMSQSYVIL